MSRISFLTVCLASSIYAATSPAVEPEPLVSLLVSKVTAKQYARDVIVHCEATLDNATGSDLSVRSSFFSAFDGLEIVVTNRDGKLLTQVSYLEHQALFNFDGRDFPLKQGKTVKKLTFVLNRLSEETRAVRVRLVGTLPGSNYKRLLSSETLAVEIEKVAGE